MTSEWRQFTLEDVIQLTYGKGLPERNRAVSGTVPVYGSNGIVGYHNQALTDGPTIVIGRKGTVGAVHYSPVPCWPIDTTFFIYDKDHDLVRYWFYLLKSLGLEQMNSDSAVPGLNRDAAHARKVSLPVLESEQRAIAHILGTLDDKIELNQKMNETLEAMAMALFKSWFVDFDPVRAKMEGRWKRGASLPGLPADFYDLFPSEHIDSELGSLPSGWCVGKLEQIADIIGGGTPSTSEASYYCDSGKGISWLSPKDLSGYFWKYISNGATDITELGLKNSSARIMPRGTVLFSSRAQIGYMAIAENDLCTNQGFKSLVPKNGANSEFLYYLLKANIEFIEARAHGSTFKEISGHGMKELPVICPPAPLMGSFKMVVSKFSELQKEIRHETKLLAVIRDFLLPKLISGQIRINDAEKIVESHI